MYMFCCWSRSPEEQADDATRSMRSPRSQMSPSPREIVRGRTKRGIVVDSVPVACQEGARGSDAEKFDESVAKNDIKMLVELLDSEQPINCHMKMHPWAENPRTIGALAGTRLAMLAQTTSKEKIREAGAIPRLVSLLASDETDRVQTSVVALSFLTAECSENGTATYEAGAMPLLLNCMDAIAPGMRAASSSTLRNICIENEAYKREFVELGGLNYLVKQIGCPSSDPATFADVQLETVLNLQDMLEGEDGTLDTEYAKIVVNAGVLEKLEALLEIDDTELHSCVDEALASLSAVQKDEEEGVTSPRKANRTLAVGAPAG